MSLELIIMCCFVGWVRMRDELFGVSQTKTTSLSSSRSFSSWFYSVLSFTTLTKSVLKTPTVTTTANATSMSSASSSLLSSSWVGSLPPSYSSGSGLLIQDAENNHKRQECHFGNFSTACFLQQSPGTEWVHYSLSVNVVMIDNTTPYHQLSYCMLDFKH